jgi:hypothetical protein
MKDEKCALCKRTLKKDFSNCDHGNGVLVYENPKYKKDGRAK